MGPRATGRAASAPARQGPTERASPRAAAARARARAHTHTHRTIILSPHGTAPRGTAALHVPAARQGVPNVRERLSDLPPHANQRASERALKAYSAFAHARARERSPSRGRDRVERVSHKSCRSAQYYDKHPGLSLAWALAAAMVAPSCGGSRREGGRARRGAAARAPASAGEAPCLPSRYVCRRLPRVRRARAGRAWWHGGGARGARPVPPPRSLPPIASRAHA